MDKVIRKYKTYTTVIEVGIFGLMILLAAVGILPTNGANVGVGIF